MWLAKILRWLNFWGKKGETMGSINIEEMKEIIQSSHLNFLIGAGLSSPFLPLLNSIETRLEAETDPDRRILIYKEYLKDVMLPNLEIIDGSVNKTAGSKYKQTYDSYKNFFELISLILLRRKSTILSKQANIFTTNIDILMETVLEDCNLNYNDGFSGQMNPGFALSNFKRTIYKRSLHFENVSEIPTFNLMKTHGSLTWKKSVGGGVVFSKLEHIDKALLSKTGKDFSDKYKEILVVNPEKEKFEKTVFDLEYYELLRMYSSELEKENTVLFVMGFSMADEHIREITVRAANSNPTLKIYIFCHSKAKVEDMKRAVNYGELKYSNIEIIEPEDSALANAYTLERINKTIFEDIVSKIGSENES
jgi:SIR2-like domain